MQSDNGQANALEGGVQKVLIEEGGTTYELYFQSRDAGTFDLEALEGYEDADDDGRSGRGETSAGDERQAQFRKGQRAIKTMKGLAAFAVQAFREVGGAHVAEISVDFGLTFAGKAGIPLVTEGSAESNFNVQVKFTFPDAASS